MGVSVEQHRVTIGLFHGTCNISSIKNEYYFWNFIFLNFVFCHLVLPKIIMCCGDVEENPGPKHHGVKDIEIGHVNIRSLTAPLDMSASSQSNALSRMSKFVMVKNHILNYKYDMFGISETWLDNSIPDKDLEIPGYCKPARRDVSRRQCGVMVYVSKNLPAVRRTDIEPSDAEIICYSIQACSSKILVCNCYRAPHHDVVDFCDVTGRIVEDYGSEFDEIVFMGDMNGRNELFWSEDRTNTDGRILYAAFKSYDFDNLIHKPTRIVGDTRSCIDLLFTNNPFVFSGVGVHDKIVDICDHCPIYATLHYQYRKPECFKRWVWNFKNADYDRLRNLILHAPWQTCYVNCNVEETVSNWMGMLLSIAESCIPHYQATIRPNDKEFMNSDIRKLMKQRDKLKKEYDKCKDETTGALYRKCKNLVLSESRKADEKIKADKSAEISHANPSSKKWWKSLKESFSSSTPSADGPILYEGKIITDNKLKCEIFNDFFISQSTLDESSVSVPNDYPDHRLRIDQLVIQPEQVFLYLSKLDISKATGPDGIGNQILKEAAVPLAQPLCHLFNYCISLGHFPDTWKIASVLPLFKKDDPLVCTNYRPISLLPCISKVFERALFNHIFDFLRKHNILKRNQSGFIPGDSTINQLIAICNKLYKCSDEGDEMVAVFLDLTKAFDKVWHRGLLYKMKKCGIGGKLYDLLTSYLTSRKQFVTIGGSSSSLATIKAGIPQGSVLGPLLFLIYINDISNDLQSESFLFADDTSLFQRVYNGRTSMAVNCLNRDLDVIDKWAKQWLVKINIKKTVVMLFSRKRTPSSLPPVMLGTTSLNVVEMHKHLGLTFEKDLSWSSHISSLVSRCNKIIGMLTRFKYTWSRQSLEICYKSFIRPIIEYGNVLYNNCNKEDSDRLESVQLNAARLVTGGKRGTSHESLYRELGWNTLKTRRDNTGLTFVYKMLNRDAPDYLCKVIEPFIPRHAKGTRSHSFMNLLVPKCNTSMYKHFFIISSINPWNDLQPSLKCSPSRLSFKRSVEKLTVISSHLFNHCTDRQTQVAFAQIRMGFSNLKDDLFKRNCIANNICDCGEGKEDAKHYFLKCSKYVIFRNTMLNEIRKKFNLTVTLSVLMYGKSTLSDDENMFIFQYVYSYIKQTKRFTHT